MRCQEVPTPLDLCPLVHSDDSKEEAKENISSAYANIFVSLMEQYLDYILVEWIYTRMQEGEGLTMNDVLEFPLEWTFKMQREETLDASSDWLEQRWLRDVSKKVSSAIEHSQNNFCERFQATLVKAICVTAPDLLEGLAERLQLSINLLVSTLFYFHTL